MTPIERRESMGEIIDSIYSLLRKGRAMTSDLEELQKMNKSSLTKAVDSSTFMFSCLVSDTIPIDQATTIVRNMERVYATIVQQFFSQNQMIDITIDRSPLDYIQKFHTNYKSESVIDFDELHRGMEKKEKFISYMESACPELEVPEDLFEPLMEDVYKGEYRLFINPAGTYGIAFRESVMTPELLKDYKEQLTEYMQDFDLHPFPPTVAMEAPDNTRSEILNGYIQGLENQGKARARDLDVKQWKEIQAPKMLDRDVKKTNDMQPYAIQLRLMAVNDKREFVQYMDFIVGVKAVLHPLKSQELVSNIAYVLQNKNFTFNMIRWLSGEISLFRNIILNIDEIKFDVTNRTSGMSNWIPTLKRLRNKRVALGLFGVHKLVPNNTIVITSYEVDEIRNLTGLDLRDVAVAKKVIEKLFSIALIIVDEGTETIDILYDSRGDYQTYSLETLEREVSMNSNRLGKEIGRMISR